MAKADRAELLLVHVLTPVMPTVGDGPISPTTWEDIGASARAAGQKGLDGLRARAKKAGVRVRTLLFEGIPHEEIVRAIRRTRPDVLVMGTHGRTGLARFFLGSVTARVIASASCPVLTVRGK
jgi:nucleotide-binding universal stress UspA family protein